MNGLAIRIQEEGHAFRQYRDGTQDRDNERQNARSNALRNHVALSRMR
jgi:hypothetical protein